MFDPFKKKPGENIALSDLQVLLTRHVAEGLFVEYKRTFPADNIKVARSIASFANSYGGWYMVGIESKPPENIPQSLCGIDLTQHPDPGAKVRDIAKSHIDPFPSFLSQLITLAPDRSVLVVQIPSNQDKPFVTSDGRIYRRNADSSDPVFEKDRYTIDRLYSDGRRFRKRFLALRKEPSESVTADQPNLSVVIAPYPGTIQRSESHFVVDNIAELLERTKQLFRIPFYESSFDGNLPLNTGYAGGESLVFRQASPQAGYRGASIRMDLTTGEAKIEIPLCFYSSSDIDAFENEEVRKLIENLGSPLYFLDLGMAVIMLAGLVSFYFYWLDEQPLISEFRWAATLNNMKDVLPVFDDVEWSRHVERLGLPVLHQKRVLIPNSGWYIWHVEDESMPLWQIIALFTSFAVGIPENIFDGALSSSMKRVISLDGSISSSWTKGSHTDWFSKRQGPGSY